jgi:hypothetical protein
VFIYARRSSANLTIESVAALTFAELQICTKPVARPFQWDRQIARRSAIKL